MPENTVVLEVTAPEQLDSGSAVTTLPAFDVLLGMLTYSPSLVLLGDDVDDPIVLRESAAVALADSQDWEREAWASMALDVLTGRTPSVLATFVGRLSVAITRAFGVTA
ncbi:hypothetical protein SNE510_68640 [Streptomyces sp. NE5-10]|uniref:hypothetical protein n=1 Tax=Streptomyces sp. NE5-10 TaxID=2759674 RepID=UPI001904E90A|nr:hypothetical protein [Streptomyces sp. NE5-10]GHJ97345.1 hypothetical protein SNE510_68640 [Streptomyces sp. NE5-10]